MPNVVYEARKAHRIMKNLAIHINKYTNDSLYIGNILILRLQRSEKGILNLNSMPEAMMKLKENIHEFPKDVDLHNLGLLEKIIESIEMKILTSEDHYKKYKLLIFQDYLGKVSSGKEI